MSDAALFVQSSPEYFLGERREMVAILIGGAAALALGATAYLRLRDSFALGFGATVSLAGLPLVGTAWFLWLRDGPLHAALVREAEGGGVQAVREREAQRVGQVVRNYPLFRHAALGIGILALILAGVVEAGLARGIAAGLLLLVAAQLVIDHYSEHRAMGYQERLEAPTDMAVPR